MSARNEHILRSILEILYPPNLKSRLLLEMGSQDSETALRAVEALRVRGWLEDGTVRGVFAGAALRAANLAYAALPAVDLYRADLSGADLRGANLRNANFNGANLRDADLSQADLRQAFLWGADLRGANLTGADLRGAFLGPNDERRAAKHIAQFLEQRGTVGSETSDAQLSAPQFDQHTILPDGSFWFPQADIERLALPVQRSTALKAHDR